MCSLINKQLLLTAYAYLFIMEQQKAQQGSEVLQLPPEAHASEFERERNEFTKKMLDMSKGAAADASRKLLECCSSCGKKVKAKPSTLSQWRCDGVKLPGGCVQGCPAKAEKVEGHVKCPETLYWTLHRCSSCDLDYCAGCHVRSLVDARLKDLKEIETAKLEEAIQAAQRVEEYLINLNWEELWKRNCVHDCDYITRAEKDVWDVVKNKAKLIRPPLADGIAAAKEKLKQLEQLKKKAKELGVKDVDALIKNKSPAEARSVLVTEIVNAKKVVFEKFELYVESDWETVKLTLAKHEMKPHSKGEALGWVNGTLDDKMTTQDRKEVFGRMKEVVANCDNNLNEVDVKKFLDYMNTKAAGKMFLKDITNTMSSLQLPPPCSPVSLKELRQKFDENTFNGKRIVEFLEDEGRVPHGRSFAQFFQSCAEGFNVTAMLKQLRTEEGRDVEQRIREAEDFMMMMKDKNADSIQLLKKEIADAKTLEELKQKWKELSNMDPVRLPGDYPEKKATLAEKINFMERFIGQIKELAAMLAKRGWRKEWRERKWKAFWENDWADPNKRLSFIARAREETGGEDVAEVVRRIGQMLDKSQTLKTNCRSGNVDHKKSPEDSFARLKENVVLATMSSDVFDLAVKNAQAMATVRKVAMNTVDEPLKKTQNLNRLEKRYVGDGNLLKLEFAVAKQL